MSVGESGRSDLDDRNLQILLEKNGAVFQHPPSSYLVTSETTKSHKSMYAQSNDIIRRCF